MPSAPAGGPFDQTAQNPAECNGVEINDPANLGHTAQTPPVTSSNTKPSSKSGPRRPPRTGPDTVAGEHLAQARLALKDFQ
jgi:hypothetical protein